VRVSTPSTPTKPIEFTNVQEHWNDSATIKGTADAYSQIKIYDGTTPLGTVTANAKGTWSFTTTQLSDTLHTFKAQELDSTGHVVATSSGTAILAASNTSTLTGTGGDDFLYSSSSQLNDTFVFASNFGHSTIEGFTVAGSGQDTIQFSKTVFDSFASVLSHATQAGQDVVISTGVDTLTLKNIKLGALNSHDFHFA
jgi:Bacterial Ig-like domain